MGMSGSGGDDFVSEINVTPFVDVMLVLLIIFMVTAPMMIEGLDVDLPPVQTADTLKTEDDHLILTVKSDGSLFLGEYPTALADLDFILKTQVLGPRKQLFLRADRNVPYGVVADVMSRTRAAGIYDLGIVTAAEPDSQKAETGTTEIPTGGVQQPPENTEAGGGL